MAPLAEEFDDHERFPEEARNRLHKMGMLSIYYTM